MKNNELKISMDADLNLIKREEKSDRVLEIRVNAPMSVSTKTRYPLNLALVLDRSGSMSGDKLIYVKKAASHVIDLLKEGDRVALVIFDHVAEVLTSSINITPESKALLKQRVMQVETRGNTNLGDGWLHGAQEVADHATSQSINRVLMLTDGLANEGVTRLEILAQYAHEMASRGVTTSTFGVGEGFNEHLLEAMANEGSGKYYYIESPLDIPALFEREFKDLVDITARDVEINFETSAKVEWKVFGEWRHSVENGKLRITVGNLYSGQSQTIYCKMTTPPFSKEKHIPLTAKVWGKNEGGQLMEDQVSLEFKFAKIEKVNAAAVNAELMIRFTAVELADTATEALKMERRGERIHANSLLRGQMLQSAPYMSSDQSRRYSQLSEDVLKEMDEGDRKRRHYEAYIQKKMNGNNP